MDFETRSSYLIPILFLELFVLVGMKTWNILCISRETSFQYPTPTPTPTIARNGARSSTDVVLITESDLLLLIIVNLFHCSFALVSRHTQNGRRYFAALREVIATGTTLKRVTIMATLSSLTSPQLVTTITCGTVSDNNLGIMSCFLVNHAQINRPIILHKEVIGGPRELYCVLTQWCTPTHPTPLTVPTPPHHSTVSEVRCDCQGFGLVARIEASILVFDTKQVLYWPVLGQIQFCSCDRRCKNCLDTKPVLYQGRFCSLTGVCS